VLLAVTAIVAPQLFTPSTALAQAISLDGDSGCLTKAYPDGPFEPNGLFYTTCHFEQNSLFDPTVPSGPDGLFHSTWPPEPDGLFNPTGPSGPDTLFEPDALCYPTGSSEPDCLFYTTGHFEPDGLFHSNGPSGPTALFNPTGLAGPDFLIATPGLFKPDGLLYPTAPPDQDALFSRDGPSEPDVTRIDRYCQYAEPSYAHRPPPARATRTPGRWVPTRGSPSCSDPAGAGALRTGRARCWVPRQSPHAARPRLTEAGTQKSIPRVTASSSRTGT
jgi:hypothetical protein